MQSWNISKQIEGADVISSESSNVNLYTSSGQFVANVPVMPFIVAPQVLTWGNRSFALTKMDFWAKPGDSTQYREVFNFNVPLFYNIGFNQWETSLSGQSEINKPSFPENYPELKQKSHPNQRGEAMVNAPVPHLNEKTCRVCGGGGGLHNSASCPELVKELEVLVQKEKQGQP